ncbi:MAG: hypothetical protein N2039_00300 [Gemmataceae bacterium]|nr:hypothetical protein [Gemmataceae bacterium]
MWRWVFVCWLAMSVQSVMAQFPGIPSAPAVQPKIEPLPFTPYVPPVHCIGKVGRDFINCVIPDWRVLAGASFFNTEFESVYNRLYREVRRESELARRRELPPPPPVDDPTRALLLIEVDPRAEVFVENYPLRQPKAIREFTSPPLPPGEYEYGIRIQWHDGNQMRESKLTVPVQPGRRTRVVALTPGLDSGR